MDYLSTDRPTHTHTRQVFESRVCDQELILSATDIKPIELDLELHYTRTTQSKDKHRGWNERILFNSVSDED